MKKVLVFTGAGVSAESGIPTFRASDGLWCNHNISEVATPGKKLSPEHVEKLSKVHRERGRSQKEIENRVSSYMSRPYAKYGDKIWTYTDLVSELRFKDKNRLSKIKGGRYKNDIGIEFL